jgi:hypothetical protein
MITSVVERYAELRGTTLAMPPSRAYAMFDGLFQQALLRQLAGAEGATDELRDGALQFLQLTVAR